MPSFLRSVRYWVLTRWVASSHGTQGRIKDARGPWHSVCLTPTPPTPEVRVCATNIFIGSDIVAATIFRFVNGRCHHYTSSTCVTSCLSSEIDITPCIWKLNCLFQTKLSERIDFFLGYKDLLVCFFLCFHCLNNITQLCYHCHVLGHNN